MPISIKPIPRKNPRDKSVKYYVQLDTQTPVDRAEFLDRMEKRSTMSSADVKGCLDALEYELKQSLLAGNAVRLGDLGSFHLTVRSKGVPTADKVSADLIQRVKVQFRPSAALTRDMQPATKGKARFIKKGEAASGSGD